MNSDLSGYRIMWVIALFDLPSKTPAETSRAVKFRATLLEEGFVMMQYSVYIKPYHSKQATEPLQNKLTAKLPPRGKVNLITITDKQYEQIISLHTPEKMQKNPEQLTVF